MGVFKNRSGLIPVAAGGWHLSKAEYFSYELYRQFGLYLFYFLISFSLSFFSFFNFYLFIYLVHIKNAK